MTRVSPKSCQIKGLGTQHLHACTHMQHTCFQWGLVSKEPKVIYKALVEKSLSFVYS